MAEITLTLTEALKRALALHGAGDRAQAELIYRKIIGAKSDHFHALHLLGVLRHERGDDEEADQLLSQAIALKPDFADAYFNRGNALKGLKRIDDALASYDMAISLKPDYADAYNNRGNVLRGLKRFDEALSSYDEAVTLRPDLAEVYNNRGNALKDLKRFEEAFACYDKAIALKPDYADAYNNRGNALKGLERLDEALVSYDKALALEPDMAEAYNNRGNVLQDLEGRGDAIASYDKAIALKPDYAEAHYNRGNGLMELTRFVDALASYDKAIVLRPDYAEAYHNRSLCLLFLERYQEGWRQFEWRKKKPEPVGRRPYSQPLWLGNENIAGKALFIYWEQGIGDTLQFCRYVPLAAALGAHVILEVQPPLVTLLRSLPGVAKLVARGEAVPHFDFHCPIMSLPLAFQTRRETIPARVPYLMPSKEIIEKWRSRLGGNGPKIGVAWAGNANFPADRNRSILLKNILPIFSIPGAKYFSIQKDLRNGDQAILSANPHIVQLGHAISDFQDTAAIMASLDLIISSDTSVVHLAGALGRPVWVLLQFIADWRWLLDCNDSPWYPTARLFRQDDTRSWANVVERVCAALHDFLQGAARPSV